MNAEHARRLGELALPGFVIGVTAGLIAGGLTLTAGQSTGGAVVAAVTLGLPLGLLGGGYSLLMGKGVIKPGVFTVAGLYWLAGFPLARLCQEAATSAYLTGTPALREGLLPFLAFQGLISLGFAIGFVWLHERMTPRWLMRVQDRNPDARRLFESYVRHVEMLWRSRERRRGRAPAARDEGVR
ncbi:hypothetical protein [Thermostaphylospora chromogena]|uniref:Uncharacterized protein n=1 Tax=Thermostaphylospora chromogena TaxID=35622 RepID=A0A1H1F3C2_9ACTN|nr:hypothetical protein [Thermostaphylospora chromogena]SDQ95400.1 hypothetical protein SAMN04489764_2762 [Thermostaphylospora chromogena]